MPPEVLPRSRRARHRRIGRELGLVRHGRGQRAAGDGRVHRGHPRPQLGQELLPRADHRHRQRRQLLVVDVEQVAAAAISLGDPAQHRVAAAQHLVERLGRRSRPPPEHRVVEERCAGAPRTTARSRANNTTFILPK
jgi:hypothetical protein